MEALTNGFPGATCSRGSTVAGELVPEENEELQNHVSAELHFALVNVHLK